MNKKAKVIVGVTGRKDCVEIVRESWTEGCNLARRVVRDGIVVVPKNSGKEGSYGLDDIGFERPQGVSACFQQQIAECE